MSRSAPRSAGRAQRAPARPGRRAAGHHPGYARQLCRAERETTGPGSGAGTGTDAGCAALAPPGVPLHRSRSERFDELVLEAVARLEPRWEAQLSGVEFAVEEIPPPGPPGIGPESVSLARLDPGSPGRGFPDPGFPDPAPGPGPPASSDPGDGAVARPPRIVVYRRPLSARADSEDELSELVFEVVVEEFARLLGVHPEDVDPGFGEDE